MAAYLTEYYAGAGEEPGVWVGEPARRLALEGQVQREDLVAVLEGRDPRDGTRLGRAFRERVLADGRVVRPVIGFDATFSAPKTVSIMWALTHDPGWTVAHDTAVRAVIDHLQAHAATTRVRTKTGRDYPDTGGLIIATFRQHTSRADDPQLHTHTFISSKVQTVDGGWWALDARYLKRYQRALGGLYQTVLRAELTARYGVEWGPVVNGQAELAAVPAELVEQFSKRTNQVDTVLDAKIEAFTTRNGRPPTTYERAALTREAALDSRAAKTGLTQQDLTVEWDTQARGLGWDPARLITHVTPAAQLRQAQVAVGSLGAVAVTQQWVTGLGAPGGVFDQLTTHLSTSSTWHRGDVVRAVTDLAEPPAVLAGEQWAQLVESVVDRYLAERCLSLDPPGTSGVVRGSDGRSVRVDPMIGPYTTGAILAQEEHLLTWTLDHTTDTAAPSATTARDLDRGTRLDPTQHAAAALVAGGDPLVLIVGPAGTGKTSTLTAAVADLEQQGRVVFGVAPSNQAAHVLASETGMRADSVAKLLYEHTRPDRTPGAVWALPVGATLVVDEAGMLATGDLHQLTQLVDQHQWRLVLVGDPYQLPAVGRGGMFAELLAHTDPVELTVVRRFTAEWEGPASLALRHGDPDVVATYQHHDRIRTGTFDEHTRTITDQWLHHTAAGETVAITAATNDEVERLNTSLQSARLERGDLDPTVAVAGAGGDQLHPGDVVATRRNDRTLTTDRGHIIKNRAQWTVTHTDPVAGTITVHGRDGTIALPADYVAEHVRLAYATTVYGTQGATVDRAVTLVSGATDHRNLYVGATRGRDVNELHVIADSMEDARDVLEQALVRDRVDTPAVTVRRELLEQEHGRGVAAGARTPAATPRIPGVGAGVGTSGEPPMVAATAGPPDARHPEPTPTNPFHGLETVAQALHRLEDERAARNEPREQYRALQTQLHTLRREREQLDKPWSPYEHSPLDRVRSLRHNAGVDVSQLTARLQHSLWRDRRHVRHLLSDATARLDAAEVAFRETYQHEAGRLDPLIAAATDQLEQTPRPEPVGVRDRELEETIGWFRWEISVGNGDRPTLDALHQRRDGLDRAASGRRLSWGEQAVHQAVGDELDGRGVQYQQAVDSQRRQQHALERMRMPVRVRDVGPELGL